LLDEAAAAAVDAEAERAAAELRTRMAADDEVAVDDLFAHVYAAPTAALTEQRALLRAELADAAERA
jgi:pyruvate dehydrogenase E1 component alpha subunit